MITQPSMARLIESIKGELTTKILPALEDPTLRVNVQMMTAVLNALQVRVEHELAWMREESDAIEAAADRVLPGLAASATVDAANAALATYRAEKGHSLLLSEAQADYQRASALLSRLAAAAYSSADASAIAEVEALFDHRLATEQAAIGEFIAVGRD